MRLSAFDAYVLFLSLKNHFTQEKYDYFKYKGKIKNVSRESFASSKDRFLYQRICREYDEKAILDFFVANFVKGKVWIRDFLEEEAQDDYMGYLKRKQSLTYTFSEDLDKLFSNYSPEVAFRVKGGMPPILNSVMCGIVSPETFALLDNFLQLSKVYDEKLQGDFIWSKYRLLASKFHPFLVYDRDKMKSILKEKIDDYRLSSERQETSNQEKRKTEKA